MLTSGSGSKIQMLEYQDDALVDMSGGTPPVSGTKYEWSTDGSVANALGTQKNVRIIGIECKVTWTVQPTPLEVHITVDGVELTGGMTNPTTATSYYVIMRSFSAGALVVSTVDSLPSSPFIVEGRSVKVEVETTGGTVSALTARVKWAKIP